MKFEIETETHFLLPFVLHGGRIRKFQLSTQMFFEDFKKAKSRGKKLVVK